MSTSPPKLLVGLALLYWGYLTGHLAAAIPAALLGVEVTSEHTVGF